MAHALSTHLPNRAGEPKAGAQKEAAPDLCCASARSCGCCETVRAELRAAALSPVADEAMATAAAPAIRHEGAEDEGAVPIIDLTPLREGGEVGKAAVAAAIQRACERVGFFIVTSHGVPQEVIDNAWARARAFFDLPFEVKASVPMDESYPYGYCGMGGEVLAKGKEAEEGGKQATGGGADLKESFSVGPYDPRSTMPPPRWPPEAAAPQFAEALTAYYQAMESLAAQLMEAFALALDLPSAWFTEKMAGHCSALRVLNYPNLAGKPPPAPGQLRASAHTDYGVLTILRQDEPGLQVQTRGGVWRDVPLLPHAYVINLGDLMARWTNDRWKSTPHRVVCPASPPPSTSTPPATEPVEAHSGAGAPSSSSTKGDQRQQEATEEEAPKEEGKGTKSNRRQSMAYFCNLPPGATVECIGTCVGPDETSKYPPINALEFLLQKHRAATGGGGGGSGSNGNGEEGGSKG